MADFVCFCLNKLDKSGFKLLSYDYYLTFDLHFFDFMDKTRLKTFLPIWPQSYCLNSLFQSLLKCRWTRRNQWSCSCNRKVFIRSIFLYWCSASGFSHMLVEGRRGVLFLPYDFPRRCVEGQGDPKTQPYLHT